MTRTYVECIAQVSHAAFHRLAPHMLGRLVCMCCHPPSSAEQANGGRPPVDEARIAAMQALADAEHEPSATPTAGAASRAGRRCPTAAARASARLRGKRWNARRPDDWIGQL